MAGMDEVEPDLGLQQDPDARAEVAQEAPDRERIVVDGRPIGVVDFTDLRFFARRGQTALGFTFRVTMDSEGRVLKQGWMDD